MRLTSRAILIVLLIGFGFCSHAHGAAATAPSTAPAYEIPKSRTPTVGTRYRVRVSVARTSQSSTHWADAAPQDGQSHAKREEKLELDGTAEVMGVSAGRDTKLSLTATRCMLTKDGKTRQLLAPGQTVVAELRPGKDDDHPDETVLSFPGGTAPATADQDLLHRVLLLEGPNVPSGDDIFGTDRPQHVGDTWPINAGLLAKRFSQGKVDANDIWGQCELIGVTNDEDQVPCLQVRIDVQIKDCKLPSLPPGLDQAVQISGSARMSGATLTPIERDPAGPRGRRSSADEMRASIRYRDGNSGRWVIGDYQWLTLRETVYKPIAADAPASPQPAAPTQPATQPAQ